jgi:hypothetical protein
MMDTDNPLSENHNRKFYSDIWQKYKNNEDLAGEESKMADLMALHKDWYKYWESPEDFDYTEFNPFAHLTFDTIILNQIDNNDPPQAKLTYNKLTSRGLSHLEAIHEIASVFAEEFFNTFKLNKTFNVKRYSGRLKELK